MNGRGKWIMIIVVMVMVVSCGHKMTYEELSDRLFKEGLVNKRWFKEWNASEEEIREVKEIIKEINKAIARNDIKKFTEFFGERVEVVNTLRDVREMYKEELLRDKEVMEWIKRWYFGRGKDVKQSYRDYLIKLLNSEEIEAEYKMYVRYRRGAITTKEELYSYNDWTKKAIYKYLFGFVYSIHDNLYKKDITIGLNNFGDGWKIYALWVAP